jgi:hypothetical protein
MSEDLLKRIASIDYEDYGSLHVTSIEWRDGDLLLTLDLTADEEPDIPKDILITCRSVRKSNLAPGYYQDLVISQDHVLLWHYTLPYALISFYGKAVEPLAVVGALFERHVEIAQDWIPFQKYVNSCLPLSELIKGTFGMLADGPEPLVVGYEDVMQRFGFSTSHHRSIVPLDASLSVIMFDESYVIAEDIKANVI